MELPSVLWIPAEDLEAYLRVFHVGITYKWPEAKWDEFLTNFLEGNALIWYVSLLLLVKSSWVTLSSALVEHFEVWESSLTILQQIDCVKQLAGEPR